MINKTTYAKSMVASRSFVNFQRPTHGRINQSYILPQNKMVRSQINPGMVDFRSEMAPEYPLNSHLRVSQFVQDPHELNEAIQRRAAPKFRQMEDMNNIYSPRGLVKSQFPGRNTYVGPSPIKPKIRPKKNTVSMHNLNNVGCLKESGSIRQPSNLGRMTNFRKKNKTHHTERSHTGRTPQRNVRTTKSQKKINPANQQRFNLDPISRFKPQERVTGIKTSASMSGAHMLHGDHNMKRKRNRKKSIIKVTQIDVKGDRKQKRPKSIVNTRMESQKDLELTPGVILKKKVLTSKFGKNFGSRPQLRKKNSEVALAKKRFGETADFIYSRREMDTNYSPKQRSNQRQYEHHRRIKTTAEFRTPQAAYPNSPRHIKSPNRYFQNEKRDEYYQGIGNDLLSQTPTVHLNLDSQPTSYSNNAMVNKYLNVNQPTRVKNPDFKASESSSYLLQGNRQVRSNQRDRLRQSHATLGRDALNSLYNSNNYEQNKRKHQERMRNIRNSQISNSVYQESAKRRRKESRREDPYGSYRDEEEYYETLDAPKVQSIVDKYSAYGPGYNIYQSSSVREQQTYFKKKGKY